jgi:hypothetical protein
MVEAILFPVMGVGSGLSLALGTIFSATVIGFVPVHLKMKTNKPKNKNLVNWRCIILSFYIGMDLIAIPIIRPYRSS